jgi:hypothetical protein
MSNTEPAFPEFEATQVPSSRAPLISLVIRASLFAFALMVVSICGRSATPMRASAETTRECNGIGFPDHIEVQGALLTLNGLALRTALRRRALCSRALERPTRHSGVERPE